MLKIYSAPFETANTRDGGETSFLAENCSSGDRRDKNSGRIGRRATDLWLPYSTPFVAQLIAQNS